MKWGRLDESARGWFRTGVRWWFGRLWRRVLTVVVAVVVVVSVVTSWSPWPSTLLIRWVFDQGSRQTMEELARHAPDAELLEWIDEVSPAGERARYDVFRRADASGPQPTVIWVHGGAWISGDKSNVAGYLRILAAEG